MSLNHFNAKGNLVHITKMQRSLKNICDVVVLTLDWVLSGEYSCARVLVIFQLGVRNLFIEYSNMFHPYNETLS